MILRNDGVWERQVKPALIDALGKGSIGAPGEWKTVKNLRFLIPRSTQIRFTYPMHRPSRPIARRIARRIARWLPVAVFAALAAIPQPVAADWPDWRGPNRDGHTTDPLPTSLEDPPVVWRRTIGHGYSGAVVHGDRLVLADTTAGQETVRALQLQNGEPLWSTPVAPAWNDEFEPGPRCTPVVAEGRVFFQSNQGEFVALDLAQGKRLWGFNFADYGTVWIPNRQGGIGAATRRGNTGSPVVRGDRVVVQVGSTNNASLCAFQTRDGRLLWRSQNDLAAYSSPVIATLAGQEQVVSATCDGLVGVALADGKLLWRFPFKTGANRNVLTPLVDGDTVTFSSHTTGLRRLRITSDGEAQKATEAWFNPQIRINLSTPVLASDHFYGLGPTKNYICVNRSNAQVRWSEGGFDAVASTITDGHRLLVLLDSGEARLLSATPDKYTELGRFQACGRTFSHPAWSEGRLYVRDPGSITAYRLK